MSSTPFAGFGAQIKAVAEQNQAEKAGVVAGAVRDLEAAVADLRVHLEAVGTLAKLRGVAPPLASAVVGIISSMFLTTGERLVVASGVRGDKEQADLYAIGRDPKKPGKVVTHLDGVRKRSNHQVAVEGPWRGQGLAVDLVFLNDKGALSWDETFPWALLGTLAKAHGLVWGGDWPTLRDRPHVELMIQ